MNIDLSEIRRKTISADEYIANLEQPFRERFMTRKQTCKLQPLVIDKLKNLSRDYVIIAFSATWCKDCAEIIPILALISQATGLEVRVFGGLKKDPLSHTIKWRIPPSPPEVVTFNVEKIPLIIIVDVSGKEIDRIVESPKQWPNLEQELYERIRSR